MIIRVLPDQVSRVWNDLRGTLSSAVPNELSTTEAMSGILEAILREYAHIWLITDNAKCVGYMLTVLTANCANVTCLHIYYIQLFEHVTDDLWLDGMRKLKVFAQHLGCQYITAITDKQNVVDRALRLGARVKIAIEMEV